MEESEREGVRERVMMIEWRKRFRVRGREESRGERVEKREEERERKAKKNKETKIIPSCGCCNERAATQNVSVR